MAADYNDVLTWVKGQIMECFNNATDARIRDDWVTVSAMAANVRYFARIAEILEEKIDEGK